MRDVLAVAWEHTDNVIVDHFYTAEFSDLEQTHCFTRSLECRPGYFSVTIIHQTRTLITGLKIEDVRMQSFCM